MDPKASVLYPSTAQCTAPHINYIMLIIFKDPCPPKTSLCGITVNVFLNYIRYSNNVVSQRRIIATLTCAP